MRTLYLLSLLPVAIVAAAFSVSNREYIDLSLYPLPFEVRLPIFALVIASLFIGAVFGVTAGWFSGSRRRRKMAMRRRQIAQLQKQVGELRSTKVQKPVPSPISTRFDAPRIGE